MGVVRLGRRRDPGRRGRLRPDPAQARDPAQLPGHRAPALPAGIGRARAAPVHRHRQPTRSAPSPGTSGAGSTPRPRASTTTSGSAPTSTWTPHRATSSSTRARSRCRARPRRRTAGAVHEGPRLGQAAARRSGPASVVNVSAMSFGALSGAAVEAINRGCALAGCLHNTGEGGLRPPPARRRPGVPDRHRLLRLPRRATGASTSAGWSDLCRRSTRYGRSRSSSARAPSPAWAGCCRQRRSRRRSPRRAASRRGVTAAARPAQRSSPTSTA